MTFSGEGDYAGKTNTGELRPSLSDGCGRGRHMSKSDGLRSSDYWRERAEEARARAEGMHDAGAKETLLRIARTYDAMAQRAAGREGPQK